MAIDYTERIPNNVALADNRRLQRALESWQPNYLRWWESCGPEGTQAYDVYLRTAISVESDGWAHFGYVKMPDYRWGIFLPSRRRSAVSPLATIWANRSGRKSPVNIAACYAAWS